MKQIEFNKQSQSGMALIAVLLFLILITIAGAIAVRQSTVDLKLATADQAGTLLLNSSDSVIAHIEQAATPGNPNYNKMMSQTQGVMGYFLTNPNSKINEQVKFCYRPNGGGSELFDIRRASLLLPDGGVRNGNAGVCNPSVANDYTSVRGTAMNQIAIRGLDGRDADTDNFQMLQEGEDNSVRGVVISPKIQMHSLSILPALSSADADAIQECLSKSAAKPETQDAGQNMTSCMKSIGVPSTSLVEEATIVKETKIGSEACDIDPVACRDLKLSK